MAAAAQLAEDKEEGEMSRSIKLPQTIDVALRNIRDAKVNIVSGRHLSARINISNCTRYLPWTLEGASPRLPTTQSCL